MPQRPFLRSRIATRHRTPHVAGTARPDTSCGNPRTWHTDRSSALGTRDQNRASSASLLHLSSLDSNQDFGDFPRNPLNMRSEEHTSELQSLMRISYAVFCLKKKNTIHKKITYLNKHMTK